MAEYDEEQPRLSGNLYSGNPRPRSRHPPRSPPRRPQQQIESNPTAARTYSLTADWKILGSFYISLAFITIILLHSYANHSAERNVLGLKKCVKGEIVDWEKHEYPRGTNIGAGRGSITGIQNDPICQVQPLCDETPRAVQFIHKDKLTRADLGGTYYRAPCPRMGATISWYSESGTGYGQRIPVTKGMSFNIDDTYCLASGDGHDSEVRVKKECISDQLPEDSVKKAMREIDQCIEGDVVQWRYHNDGILSEGRGLIIGARDAEKCLVEPSCFDYDRVLPPGYYPPILDINKNHLTVYSSYYEQSCPDIGIPVYWTFMPQGGTGLASQKLTSMSRREKKCVVGKAPAESKPVHKACISPSGRFKHPPELPGKYVSCLLGSEQIKNWDYYKAVQVSIYQKDIKHEWHHRVMITFQDQTGKYEEMALSTSRQRIERSQPMYQHCHWDKAAVMKQKYKFDKYEHLDTRPAIQYSFDTVMKFVNDFQISVHPGPSLKEYPECQKYSFWLFETLTGSPSDKLEIDRDENAEGKRQMKPQLPCLDTPWEFSQKDVSCLAGLEQIRNWDPYIAVQVSIYQKEIKHSESHHRVMITFKDQTGRCLDMAFSTSVQGTGGWGSQVYYQHCHWLRVEKMEQTYGKYKQLDTRSAIQYSFDTVMEFVNDFETSVHPGPSLKEYPECQKYSFWLFEKLTGSPSDKLEKVRDENEANKS